MSIQSEIDRISANVQNSLDVIRNAGVEVPTPSSSNDLPALTEKMAGEKQNKLTGKQGQVVGFDSQGNAQAQDPPGGGSGKRVCRFVVGTSTAGWTADDCDYLCDGTADDVEINAAIQALPGTGGEIVILDGTYNITATIAMNKDNVTLSGNGSATVLKRMWDSRSIEGVITINSANGGCCIRGFCIDGNKDEYPSDKNSGIYDIKGDNCSILYNISKNNSKYGICVSAQDYNVLKGNICFDNLTGIWISGDSSVTGNQCFKNGEKGIQIGGSVSATGNCCTYNATGIFITSDNCVASSNVCCNNSNIGIELSSGGGDTISDNTCNNNDIGIYVGGRDNVVTGNSCADNNCGIRINISVGGAISGNSCMRGTGTSSDYSSSQYTIQTEKSSKNLIVVGNNIMGKNYVDSGTNNTFANNKYQ